MRLPINNRSSSFDDCHSSYVGSVIIIILIRKESQYLF